MGNSARRGGKSAGTISQRSSLIKYRIWGLLLLLIAVWLGASYLTRILQINSQNLPTKAIDSAITDQKNLREFSREDLATLLSLPTSESNEPSSFKIDLDFWTQTIDDSLHSLQSSYPDDPQVEHLIGLVQLRLNRTRLAERNLKRSLELDPNHLETRLDLAKLNLELGRDQEAIDVLQPVKNDNRLPVETSLLLGDCLQRLGRLEEAEQFFRSAATHQANNSEAWKKLAGSQLQQQKLPESQQSITRAIELGSQDAELWLWLSQCLSLQQKPTEAATALKRWQETKSRPNHETLELSFETKHSLEMARMFSNSFRSLAAFYQDHGDLQAAHRMYESALNVNPWEAAALTAWANLFRKEGNNSKALQLNRKLLRLQPQEPAHYQNYANLCMQALQPQAAEAVLRLGCLNLPNDGNLQLLLARFLLLLNQPNEAVGPARIASQILRSREAEDVLIQAEHAAQK